MSKKLRKALVILLIFTLLLSFSATSAKAANLKLRTNTYAGKPSKIQTTLPGNIKVNAQVKCNILTYTGSYEDIFGNEFTRKKVTITVRYPKKEMNKIRKNAQRIINNSQYDTRNGVRVRKSFIDTYATALNAKTGKPFANDQNDFMLFSDTKYRPISTKVFVCGEEKLEVVEAYELTFDIGLTEKIVGEALLGICGVKAPTFDDDDNINLFLWGKKSIKCTNSYCKSNKNLSTWIKF